MPLRQPEQEQSGKHLYSVADPDHFDAYSDADPSHFEADTDADPDSDFYLMRLLFRIRIKLFILMRIWIVIFI